MVCSWSWVLCLFLSGLVTCPQTHLSDHANSLDSLPMLKLILLAHFLVSNKSRWRAKWSITAMNIPSRPLDVPSFKYPRKVCVLIPQRNVKNSFCFALIWYMCAHASAGMCTCVHMLQQACGDQRALQRSPFSLPTMSAPGVTQVIRLGGQHL